MDRREPELVGRLRERGGAEASLGVAPDLLGRDRGIAQVRDLVRDEPTRVRAAPGFEVPVVVRADRRERELVVVRPQRQALAHEAGKERREAQGHVDAVDVHVADARVDVPRAAPHLVETRRLESVLARRPSDHRVEADVRQRLVLPDPGLAAVVGRDDVRLRIGVPRGKPSRERVGRFDDVIVDRDDSIHALARLGLGQPADLGPPALAATEMLVLLEVVDRHAH